MWHRRLPFAVLVASVILAAGGCSAGDGDGADSSPPQSVLRRGNGGDPVSLDPARAESVSAFRVLTDLYEGLVTIDASGSIVSGVADSWSLSEDGLIYTFQLRPEAVWSNGEPVTAKDFVAGFHRTLEPGFDSAYSFLLHPIRNSVQVLSSDLPASELGVRAPDDATLIIELESPSPHFLSVLAMAIALPLPPSAAAGFSNPDDFVGNGAYTLEDLQPGHRIRLRKNPRFRDAASVAIDVVEYYPISDLQTELNMYRAGELDITASVPGAHVNNLKEDRADELRIAPKLGLYYLAFDLSEPPFNDPASRQALSMAIDRNALTTVVGRGEEPAYGVVPDGIEGYEPARHEWQSLDSSEREDKAREVFSTSVMATDSAPQITLTYDTGDIHEKVAVAVSSMWQEVLGIDVELDKREWQYFLDTRNNRDEWQIMRFAWIGDYNHASTFTDLFHSESPQNLPGYRSAQYDNALAAATAVMNREDQNWALAEAEAILLADYAIAPLYFYVSKHLVSSAVEGFEHNALDQHPSRYLRFVSTPQPE